MTAGKAAAEIARLEKLLGIESDGAKFLYLHKANARIAELEKQLAAKAILTSPAVTAPAAKTAAPQFSRPECLAIMRAVFEESPMVFASLSDSDLLADTLARCEAAHLRLPGEPPVDCSALGNYAKVFQSQRQSRLDQLIKQWGIATAAPAPKAAQAEPAPSVPTPAKRETGLVGMARVCAAAKADLDAAGYVPKRSEA